MFPVSAVTGVAGRQFRAPYDADPPSWTKTWGEMRFAGWVGGVPGEGPQVFLSLPAKGRSCYACRAPSFCLIGVTLSHAVQGPGVTGTLSRGGQRGYAPAREIYVPADQVVPG